MNCPACGIEMVVEDFGNIEVDVCKNGCKGIWFDWFELQKLDEGHEGGGDALSDALDSPRANDAGRDQLTCPKCGIPMRTHKYSGSKEVNVDECYNCAGFFLDSGELSAIRDTFMNEQERDAYVQSLLDEIPEYRDMEADLEKRSARKKSCSTFGKLIQRTFAPGPR